MRIRKQALWSVVLGGMVGISPAVWAVEPPENKPAISQDRKENIRDRREDLANQAEDVVDRRTGPDGKESDPAEVERLKKLKEENPQAFKESVQKHRVELKERMENLKQTDPAKYEEVKGRLQAQRKERLQELKEKNPEKFKEVMEKRRENMQERLQKLKTTNPSKYEEVMARREARMEQFKENHPKAYEQWKEKHGGELAGAKDRIEDRRDKREDIRDRRNGPDDNQRGERGPNGRAASRREGENPPGPAGGPGMGVRDYGRGEGLRGGNPPGPRRGRRQDQ